MYVSRLLVTGMAVLAGLLFATTSTSVEYTIDNLAEEAGLRESGTAMRDKQRWDTSRTLIGRDIGLDLSGFGDANIVLVDSLQEALLLAAEAGAGLDVTDPEPLQLDHPLWREQNVIITPHAASWGADRFRQEVRTVENIRRYLAGDRLLNAVDSDKGY